MKKIIGIAMVLLMLMSVTVALADVNKDAQIDKTDDGFGLQIFENLELNAPSEEDFVDDEILVKFKPGVGMAKVDKINSKHGSFVRHTSPYTGTRKIAIPEGKTVAEMVKLYQAEDVVEYAKPNYICRASFVPNDPYYSYQWHFPLINMESAWEIQQGGDPEIVVAVLDTGVAYENRVEGQGRMKIIYAQAPDLAGTNFKPGRDCINDDAHPNDDNAHGTHVTGTIVQSTNNEYGVAGMAFGTSIMPVKVLDENGEGNTQSLAEGLRYATDNGADVISMSFGFSSKVTPEDIPDVTDAVAYAHDNGVILVASSGNEGVGVVSLPAACPEVIAVGAVYSGDARASYSQYGNALEIVAPGGDGGDRGVLQQTFRLGNPTDFGFWYYTGTSMAAPHVSGLIALLLAQDPARTQYEIRNILHTTSVDLGTLGWDEEYGYGRIDAYAALQWTATSNGPPIADDQSATTDEDTAAVITLAGKDPDSDSITFSVVTDPSNGALDLDQGFTNNGNLTYTPKSDFNGADSFTFKVNDGRSDSEPATVSITVNPVNGAPVANPQSVTTIEDIQVPITLTGSDVDGDPLTFNQPTNPNNVTLDLDLNYTTNGKITYTPTSGFNGSDSFAFTISDGTVNSDPATVSITVTKVNHPPVASSQDVTTEEDTPVTITLTGSDPDGDSLTYSVIVYPSHGSLTGTTPNLTYTPEPNFNGPDNFTFKANDGTVDSNIATVNITVGPVNDTPIADDQSVTTNQNTPIDITLTASDVDGDSLTYAIVADPSNGSLSGTAPSVTYMPEADYTGAVSFTFTVSDGTEDSDPATVSITVSPATSTTMHVASIDMSTTRYKANGWYTYATALVTIVNETGAVGGATVEGHWSGLTIDVDSETTDAGYATLNSDSVKNAAGTFTFTVDNVSLAGWTYDQAANVGTSYSITVP